MNDFLLYFLSIDKETTPLFSNSHIFTIVIICGRFKLKWSKKTVQKVGPSAEKQRNNCNLVQQQK